MNSLNPYDPTPWFRLDGQTAIVTGGSGVLCGAMARTLAAVGANVVILGRSAEKAEHAAQEIRAAGGQALALTADVLDKPSLEAVRERVLQTYGKIDILINGAGGNHPKATTNPQLPFFSLELSAVEQVFGTNFTGTFLACQVFGQPMAEQKSGVILNITSMSAYRPLTRVSAYGAAKAAVINFTQWLAVHMAQEYSPVIRVNALAPGFFLTEQNRYMLTDAASGQPTARGQKILDHTPMNRLGDAQDLLGATLWLVSPAAAFVTGAVIPVDGGFSAYSGV